mmetsp:Transcript_40460/g.59449  ORF Transcript_40460/g.59449 Transcript_40460/m.59449 type:complete len:361 (+) Transcript_40460:38-1120(+)
MLLRVFLFCALLSHPVDKYLVNGEDGNECFKHETEDIFEWVVNNGGFLHDSLEIKTGIHGRGMFTKDKLPQGATLVRVPLDLVIHGEGHPCHTVVKLRDEMRLDKCSKYWPYIKFMDEVVIDLPNSWSKEELSMLEGLPPGNWQIHSDRMRDDCKDITDLDENDPIALRALFLYATRAGPEGMQPIFDIFNHGYNSTWHHTPDSADHFIFQTQQGIAAGEELFNQFRPGAGAGAGTVKQMTDYGYYPDGSPEIFRDYGFLEAPPTLWSFEQYGRTQRFIVEDEAGNVSWLPNTDPKEIAIHARAYLDGLVERGISCESNEEGQCKVGTGEDLHAHHVELASLYRRSFEAALRMAIAAGGG